jgi:zinc protease
MPYSLGNLKPRDGKLYAEDRFTGETWDLQESGKHRVYTAVGNCLIGDMNGTKESMAAAWMNGSNATTMIGYVVTTWHGRNGWGALKYWVTNPKRYTLAEAVYMNQQDFLYQQNEWYPELISEKYNFCDKFMEELTTTANRLSDVLGRKIDMNNATDWDMMGFWHDRDVLVYYGDPKWDVNLQSVEGEEDYTITSTMRDGKYVITINTGANFSLAQMQGDKFKQEHVLDLPFNYFFPERLKNPRLAEGQEWKAVVDENFILVYDVKFEPNNVYEIILDVE